MSAWPGHAVLLMFALAAAIGCKQSSNEASAAGAALSAATVTAAATTTTTISGPAHGDGDDICRMQPYKRRCEAGCKAANAQAVTTTCAAETAAFSSAVPNKLDLGKCLVGCRKPGNDSSCVGAADEAACRCQLACYRSLPADVLEKAKAAEHCYAKAVASACG